MTKQEKEEYSSQTIQGLNERVTELEKNIALIADTTRKIVTILEKLIKEK